MKIKKDGWQALISIVGTAALGASTACTITTGPYNPDGAVYFGDGSVADTGTDAGVADVSTGSDGAVTCTAPDGSSSSPCETCVRQNCCAENLACLSGPMDDAGTTDCEYIAQCFNLCRHPAADSGFPADTVMNCTNLCTTGQTPRGTNHTAQGTASFKALETCTSQNCPSQCQ